jgi:hypothetical protein
MSYERTYEPKTLSSSPLPLGGEGWVRGKSGNIGDEFYMTGSSSANHENITKSPPP